jgi:hypothetical protein
VESLKEAEVSFGSEGDVGGTPDEPGVATRVEKCTFCEKSRNQVD